ncbi:MAG: nucleoside monophosphate kinase [archaeon]|nr:nucleoside monophosphate kinase [archaeon]
MILIFFGKPNSGKGTYSQFVERTFGIKQVSTGDIIREEVAKNTPLGERIDAVIKSGRLVDDETMFELFEDYLSKINLGKGIILDGFPRTLNQAQQLDKLLKKLNTKITAVFYFNASEETILRRSSGRVTCENCKKIYNTVTDLRPKVQGICDVCGGKLVQRIDDMPEVLKKRIEEYEKLTLSLIDYYKKRGLLKEFDSNPEAVKVFPIIEKEIRKLFNN